MASANRINIQVSRRRLRISIERQTVMHIHSCLSPCGDGDMTPANIAGMAALKGLDIVALTDHNTCRNCPAFMAAAAEYGLLAVPGMEINTSEEVHAVCLFPNLEAALCFDSYVYGKLIRFPNNEAIFGKQQIYNEQDQVAVFQMLWFGVLPCHHAINAHFSHSAASNRKLHGHEG